MILYIGNNIHSKTNNVTYMVTLSNLLKEEGFELLLTSSKKNQLLRMLDMLLSILKYRKKISYIFIDTYSTRNFYYALACSQLSRLFNLKYIPILHGGNLPSRLKSSSKMCKLIFKHSYRNIAPSNYLKDAFENKGYETTFIPNVLDINAYKFKIREKFIPSLLYVRAFDKIYNPQMAVSVLSELLIKHPSSKLCMVGPDKDGSLQECKNLAMSLGVSEFIEFKGLLSKTEWHKLSEEFDLFINTTNIDNTPVSILEAMALGLPVVSTDVGGIPYLIEDSVTGILVSSNDIQGMVNRIVKYLDAQKDLQYIAQNARKKVEYFDWNTVKQRWIDIL
ncbi:MAG: glycosyltransferase family 4 protein [Flavobacteriaceae bacterium]|nr:glycosyltransferase family 4 protein [Flavobacteriaceae bacterium]